MIEQICKDLEKKYHLKKKRSSALDSALNLPTEKTTSTTSVILCVVVTPSVVCNHKHSKPIKMVFRIAATNECHAFKPEGIAKKIQKVFLLYISEKSHFLD